MLRDLLSTQVNDQPKRKLLTFSLHEKYYTESTGRERF